MRSSRARSIGRESESARAVVGRAGPGKGREVEREARRAPIETGQMGAGTGVRSRRACDVLPGIRTEMSFLRIAVEKRGGDRLGSVRRLVAAAGRNGPNLWVTLWVKAQR